MHVLFVPNLLNTLNESIVQHKYLTKRTNSLSCVLFGSLIRIAISGLNNIIECSPIGCERLSVHLQLLYLNTAIVCIYVERGISITNFKM